MATDPFSIRSFQKDVLEEAWLWTFAGTTGLETVASRFMVPWIQAHYDGTDTRKLSREIEEHVLQCSWSWPWFSHWFAIFKERDVWPAQWGLIGRAVRRGATPMGGDASEEIEEAAARLLDITAMSRAAGLRDLRQRQDPDVARYWTWELIRGMEPEGVFEIVNREFGASIAALYPSSETPFPPLFPGDMTDVRGRRRSSSGTP